MAYDIDRKHIMDPNGGREDSSKRIVRAVGRPEERYREDPLRLIRGVRIAAELGFRIEEETLQAMIRMVDDLADVAEERIREEMMKILMSEKPSQWFYLMRRTGLLNAFLPELLEGYLKRQNVHHGYTVFRHILETIDEVKPDLILRLTALMHDIAKPRVRKKIDGVFRFIGHDSASALLAEEILSRLKFSRETIGRVVNLVRHHMVFYNPQWSDGAVRRFIARVGSGNVGDLMAFRKADLRAHGVLDHKMDQLLELEERIKRLSEKRFPIKPTELAIDGWRVMKLLDLKPGPAVGNVLNGLMEKVLDHPELNTEKDLISLVKAHALSLDTKIN
jgi:poly(A) polymerase/tRNA nucleotidyltransferase (CCA-adding enzyme)